MTVTKVIPIFVIGLPPWARAEVRIGDEGIRIFTSQNRMVGVIRPWGYGGGIYVGPPDKWGDYTRMIAHSSDGVPMSIYLATDRKDRTNKILEVREGAVYASSGGTSYDKKVAVSNDKYLELLLGGAVAALMVAGEMYIE